jgi:small GTP-binding protein
MNERDSRIRNMVHYKKINIFGCSEVGKSSLILSIKNYSDNDFKLEIEGEIIGSNDSGENDNKEENLKLTEQIKRVNVPFNENYELFLNLYETNIDNINLIKDHIDVLITDSECIIFMIDINSVDSFSSISELILIITEINDKNEENKNLPPMIIISNKTDLERKVSENEIKELIDKYPNIVNMELSLYDQNSFQKFMKNFVMILQKEEQKEILDHIHLVKIQDPPGFVKNLENDIKKTSEQICLYLFFLGMSTVGKTTFVKKFMGYELLETSLSTLGIDVEKTTATIGDTCIRIELWDTAGQERLRSMPKRYYSKGNGFLLLFDVTKKSTFNDIINWIKDIREARGGDDENNDKKKIDSKEVLFLIGNKIDDTQNREVKKEEALKLAEEYGLSYFEVSSKEGINVYEIVTKLIFEAFSKSKESKKFFKLQSQQNTKKKKKCCF